MFELLTCLSIAMGLVAADPAPGTVFDTLTQSGVRLPTGESIRLPMPVMPDGLDAAKQTEILRKLAGKFPFDRFVRDAVVAPFVLEINSVEDSNERRGGQRLDFYFVAYGSQKALFEPGLFDELVGVQEAKSSGLEMTTHSLTADELRKRNLTVRDAGDVVETYVAVDLPLLERVQISVAGLGVKRKSSESIIGAWMLDDRFVDDPEFPNRWRPILRDEAGRMSLGDATPHSGLGGYIKITLLQEPKGALLVECHAAFNEPYGWFEGKNLLRSKLPIAVQENVRTFRRKLAKLNEQ